MTDYVYGIVETGTPPPEGPGVAGSAVRVLADGEAAALVSDMEGDAPRLGREELLAHAAVLEQALARGTVLPMRFGIVMEDDAAVRERLLENHAGDLRAQLEEFKDKVEVNIRATYDEERLMREVLGESRELAELREALKGRPEDATYYERIRLGELVAKAIDRKRAIDSQNIVDALAQVSLASRVGEPAHERVALNAAFLVERGRLGQFDEVLEAFAAGQSGRIRFKYTGPLPPHSFVTFGHGE